jgi:hypothetical protein
LLADVYGAVEKSTVAQSVTVLPNVAVTVAVIVMVIEYPC